MSSILSTIEKIRDENSFRAAFTQHASILHNHRCELDDVDRMIYIRAEVHPDCLDRGSDITAHTSGCVKIEGDPGDMGLQLISKRLGGPGHHFNFIPLNKKIEMTAWKENETKIYEHVKKGGDRYARVFVALEYDDEDEHEILRPIKLYYHFALYENDQPVDEVMEGVIDNPSQKSYKKVKQTAPTTSST
ncbi:hypothetical protein M3Y95_00760200 [Aphelenchoides besseyi]|nr:hypothetical protein M3Y95_00760200 [Aphelenchoides besseyi]